MTNLILRFGHDPLQLHPILFRIRDCPFAFPGIYAIEFWYNDEKVEERPLSLR